jgi:hypothetical protein
MVYLFDVVFPAAIHGLLFIGILMAAGGYLIGNMRVSEFKKR